MRSIFVLITGLTIQTLWSQDGLSIQANWQAGRIISHSKLYVRPNAVQQAFVLDINKKTSGKKYWQAAHNYPQMGLNLAFRNFNNKYSLGHAFIAIPYLEFNVLKNHLGTFQIKHGTGLAVVSRIHDVIRNPENLLLYTHLNASSILDIGYHFNTTTKWDIKTGVTLSHISNGNFKSPNSGVNTLFGYLGIIYFLREKNVTTTTYPKDSILRRLNWRIGLATGFYNYNEVTKKLKTNDQLQFLLFYQHNTRFRTGAGLEAGHLRSDIQTALYVEEEVLFGNLVTRYGIGFYLAHADMERSRFYEKVGIAYYPFPLKNRIAHGFSIGANIKAHSFDASHIELIANYLF